MDRYVSPRNGCIMDQDGPITVTLANGKEVLAQYYDEDVFPRPFTSWAAARSELAIQGHGWTLWQAPLSHTIFLVRTT